MSSVQHVNQGNAEVGESPKRIKRQRLTASESTTMTARVPLALSKTYDAISLITGLSVGALVRKALEEYVVRHWSPQRLASELAAARQAQAAARAEADALATTGLEDAAASVSDL